MSGFDVLAAAICGVNTRISHAHGTYIMPKYFLDKVVCTFSKFLIKHFSTSKIAVSHIAGDTLFSSKDYELILNSVDFSVYDNIEKKEHNGINILQVGYFCSNKNQLFSLNLVNELVSNGNSVHLYLIGFELDAVYTEKIKQYIDDNKLSNFVSILPQDYDKFLLYPSIDYMVLPSGTEGLPIVSLECQAARIPCIASLGITEDADLGLLLRVSVNNKDEWIKILSHKFDSCQYDTKKAERFDRKVFIRSIRNIYDK